jgi:hypothetical protein
MKFKGMSKKQYKGHNANATISSKQIRVDKKRKEKIKNGAPGKTRTPNLLIRSQTLYPIELRAQKEC